MHTTGYVSSYVNPDTDGVSTAIGYSYLMECIGNSRFTPVFFGTFNRETLFVLSYFGVKQPQTVSEIPLGTRVC
jgi:inorganic pyrophosphatase/exopolyphosphatase